MTVFLGFGDDTFLDVEGDSYRGLQGQYENLHDTF